MSPTSKPSKQSEPEPEWILPSRLKRGDVVTVVHAHTGDMLTGRVLSTDLGLGCRIRLIDNSGVTLALNHQYIEDKNYTVRNINGHEMH